MQFLFVNCVSLILKKDEPQESSSNDWTDDGTTQQGINNQEGKHWLEKFQQFSCILHLKCFQVAEFIV